MTDKSREAFESFMRTHWGAALHIKAGTGDYTSNYVQIAWVAWQAAIEYAKAEAVRVCENIEAEADVVQKITGSTHTDGVRYGAASCTTAIKEAL